MKRRHETWQGRKDAIGNSGNAMKHDSRKWRTSAVQAALARELHLSPGDPTLERIPRPRKLTELDRLLWLNVVVILGMIVALVALKRG